MMKTGWCRPFLNDRIRIVGFRTLQQSFEGKIHVELECPQWIRNVITDVNESWGERWMISKKRRDASLLTWWSIVLQQVPELRFLDSEDRWNKVNRLARESWSIFVQHSKFKWNCALGLPHGRNVKKSVPPDSDSFWLPSCSCHHTEGVPSFQNPSTWLAIVLNVNKTVVVVSCGSLKTNV